MFGFPLKYYVRVTRVCSNCDKTTSQSQSKTEKKCNCHNQLTISPLQTATRAIASLLDGVIILPEHCQSWVISFITDIRTALGSPDLNGSSKKVQISLSMETVKQFNFSSLTLSHKSYVKNKNLRVFLYLYIFIKSCRG